MSYHMVFKMHLIYVKLNNYCGLLTVNTVSCYLLVVKQENWGNEDHTN